MADYSALARPYAEAAYALARERSELDAWSGRLALLAAVMSDERMHAIDLNPRVERDALAALVIDICGERLDDAGRNFVRVLAENRRMPVLPEIARQFDSLKAQAEQVIEAEAAAAYELSAPEIEALTRALSARWGAQVRVTPRLDPELIGGVVVRAGDRVVDGSVQGMLRALTSHMNR